MNVEITLEYNRKLVLSETQMAEWLDDLSEDVDETMSLPLRIGDDQSSGFSPFAFCAPELIRGAVTSHILRSKLADL